MQTLPLAVFEKTGPFWGVPQNVPLSRFAGYHSPHKERRSSEKLFSHGSLARLHKVLPFLFLFVIILISACSPQKNVSPTLATVNGEAITAADFQKVLALERWKFGRKLGLPPKGRGLGQEIFMDVKARLMEQMLKDRILLQEARKQGIEVSGNELEKGMGIFQKGLEKFLQGRGQTLDDFREERKKELNIQRLIEKVTEEKIPLTEADLKNYYDAHRSDSWRSQEVHCRQLVTDSREKTEALRLQLEAGASFEDLAKQHSLSPDRRQGGDLGWFARGLMPPEFDRVCFSLKLGELSGVIQTPYGYHLFEVLALRPAGQLPFDAVKDEIRKKLVEEKGKEVFQKWYAALRDGAKISVDTARLEAIKK